MARNRMIKPEFWTSKTLMRVSRDARLTFIGLWNFADDYGVLENSNRRILGDIFPYDETVSEKDIEIWKQELLREKFIVKITYRGREYLFIRSWDEHQKVAHPAKETIPSGYIHESLMRASGDFHSQIEREVEIEVESSSNEEQAPPEISEKKVFGNKEINDMLLALKSKIGIEAFADSSIERNIAKHCVGLLQKIGKKEFVRRLDALLLDPFHSKNCNKIRYVYGQIKAFIEPKVPSSKTAFIS